MSDRVVEYHTYIGELEARIEALEAALLEIEKLEDLDAFTMQDIARAALGPEPK